MNDIFNKYDDLDIHYDVLKHNAEFLLKKYDLIKKSFLETPDVFEYEIIDATEIKNIIKGCSLYEYDAIKIFVEDIQTIYKITYENITFYAFGNVDNSFKLLKISYSFCHAMQKTDKNYEIIWIPINTKRTYEYDNLDENNMNQSKQEFKGFTASGLTFSNKSIITRFDGVEKLLIHELIHNFNLDGSKFHNHNHDEIQIYKSIKPKKTHSYTYDIYESYTELLSSYYNILYKLIIEGKNNIYESIIGNILIEYMYSLNLISIFVKLNGFDSIKLFFKDIKFKADICIFEYVYVKTIMYNRFKLSDNHSFKDFKKNLREIMKIIKNEKNLLLYEKKELDAPLNLEYIYNVGYYVN